MDSVDFDLDFDVPFYFEDEEPPEEPVVVPDEYVTQIIDLAQNITNNQFALGDLLIVLVDTFDGRKVEVCKYLQGATSLDWKTLADYETVARKWPEDKRLQFPQLAFSVFRATDPNDPDDMALLNRAVDEQLTASKVLDEKYKRKGPAYHLRAAIRNLTNIEENIEGLEDIIHELTSLAEEYKDL